MNVFMSYLNKIQSLIRIKKYDRAWSVANEGLYKIKTEDRFMMYYQMAVIAAREKKWFDALEKMGFVIYHLEGLGGMSHKRFVVRLLKKFNKEVFWEEYVKLAKNTLPKDLTIRLNSFLGMEDIKINK